MPEQINKLGDYDNIKVDNVLGEVTKEDIDDEIQKYILENKIFDREKITPQIGDWIRISIDMVSKKQVYGDIKSKNDYYVSEEEFAKGLNNGILSSKINEKNTFEIEFPENYIEKEVAGKRCICSIIVHGIYKSVEEMQNIDIVKNDDVKTIEELRRKIKKDKRQEKEYNCKVMQWENIVNDLLQNSEVKSFDSSIIKEKEEQIEKNYRMSAKELDMSLEEYAHNELGVAKGMWKEYITQKAMDELNFSIILEGIAYREKIKISDSDIYAHIARTTGMSCSNKKELREYLEKNKVELEELKKNIILNETEEWIINNVKLK